LGLVDDDREFIHAINEASCWGGGGYLRIMFVGLLIGGQLQQPSFVWDNTWEALSDDIQYRQRRVLNFEGIFSPFH
jgi:hypothetical protein